MSESGEKKAENETKGEMIRRREEKEKGSVYLDVRTRKIHGVENGTREKVA